MLHTYIYKLHNCDVRIHVTCITVIILRKLKKYGDFTKYFGLIFIDED